MTSDISAAQIAELLFRADIINLDEARGATGMLPLESARGLKFFSELQRDAR